jgi:hypothetical protein
MDCRTLEDFAPRTPRQVLQPHTSRAEGAPQGDIEVAAIRFGYGEDPGDGGMINAPMVVEDGTCAWKKAESG